MGIRKILCFVSCACLLFLTACGGGGGNLSRGESDGNKGSEESMKKGVMIITPEENAEVSLMNELIENVVKDYEPGKTYDYINKSEGDRYFPESVKFSRSGGEGDYRLLISRNKDMTQAKEYDFSSSVTEVSDLFCGTEYYSSVVNAESGEESEVRRFTTKKGPRTVKIGGTSNTRDVGGYETADGLTVKQGLVFRGGNPDNLTDGGKEWFKKFGIKTIIDLREEPSRKRTLKHLGINYPELPAKGCACYFHGDLSIRDNECRKGLITAVKVFADEKNYPIYFHCQIGRDRTGTLAYVINGLIGVEHQDLTLDYELSFLSEYGCLDFEQKDVESRKQNHYAATEGLYSNFMKYSISKKTEEPSLKDGIEEFLLRNGVTAEEIKSIREILTGVK